MSAYRDRLAGALGRVRDPGEHSPTCSDQDPCRYCTRLADALLASGALSEVWDEGLAVGMDDDRCTNEENPYRSADR